ncbi:MAG: DNA-processing protein DprA [Planctomycetota bacterium]|nr:DNA-processing protein DprA [Planctomycetota bacterium]
MDPHLLLAAAEGSNPTLIPALLDPTADPGELLCPTRARTLKLPRALQQRLANRSLLEQRVRTWLELASRLDITILTPRSETYPARLRNAPLRPLALFLKGPPRALATCQRTVAIVGSRTPTAYGRAASHDFATSLVRAGFVIWSGLAIGIDGVAHRACVSSGQPTVAVLAGGLDRIYPASHHGLAHEILAAGGCLLSETPPGQRATRGHFPRRNRILAAAVEAVLVIEAGQASGSLHTANHAAETGVPVFAVPGPYTNPRSRGCHELIAQGAQIALDPEDVLRRLQVEAGLRSNGFRMDLDLSADEEAIRRVLEQGPRPADLVQRETRLGPEHFLEVLASLQERGRIQSLAGDLLALNHPTALHEPPEKKADASRHAGEGD